MPVLENILALATEDYYSEGITYSEADHYRGDSLEIWVAALGFGENTPPEIDLTLAAAAAKDAGTISVTTTQACKLYRGDLLWFGGTQNCAIVIKTNTAINATGTTSVPVYPVPEEIASGLKTLTYALKPLLSAESGGMPADSGTNGTARNRGQSLYNSKAIFGRDYSVQISGTIVRNDPGIAIFEALRRTNRRVFWEARNRPFDNYGIGPSCCRGKGFIESYSPSSNVNEFRKFDATIGGDGKHELYLPLGMPLDRAQGQFPDDEFLAAA